MLHVVVVPQRPSERGGRDGRLPGRSRGEGAEGEGKGRVAPPKCLARPHLGAGGFAEPQREMSVPNVT